MAMMTSSMGTAAATRPASSRTGRRNTCARSITSAMPCCSAAMRWRRPAASRPIACATGPTICCCGPRPSSTGRPCMWLPCCSIRERSSYRNFEIIVVDNQSDDAAALDYFAALAESGAARVLRYTWPFNFSAINNFAVGEARGEAICLLNNDTEVISPDWMETLLGHLVQPGVGAVGAKLLFPDGRVQHAGDAVGPGGCADHLHEALERDDPGYCNRAIVAQEVSAVTAACLMTWKHLYQRLDGLNAKHLKVAFNDVDFCLRVQEAGYRVIFTPHAELYHNESATRGQDRTWRKMRRTKREADYMRARWKARMGHDPYYNPNLSYRRPDFSLSDAPRVRKPWLDGERKRR